MDSVLNETTKEELDNAIPFHILLDVSANRSRAKLAHKGMLTSRHRPSEESFSKATRKKSKHFRSKAHYIYMVCKH